LRRIIFHCEEAFCDLQGSGANKRYQLYSFVANIVSMLDIVHNKLDSNIEYSLANTNASLIRYVRRFANSNITFTDDEKNEMLKFVKIVLDIMSCINDSKIITWNFKESKRPPSISDYVTVAFYYLQKCNMMTIEEIKRSLKNRFIKLHSLDNINEVKREYFLELRKNQAQYSLTSVLKRHDIIENLMSD
jgi:hypothetical protein